MKIVAGEGNKKSEILDGPAERGPAEGGGLAEGGVRRSEGTQKHSKNNTTQR